MKRKKKRGRRYVRYALLAAGVAGILWASPATTHIYRDLLVGAATAQAKGGMCEKIYDQCMYTVRLAGGKWITQGQCLNRFKECLTGKCVSKGNKCNPDPDCQFYCTESATSRGNPVPKCCVRHTNPHVRNPCPDMIDGKCNPKLQKLNNPDTKQKQEEQKEQEKGGGMPQIPQMPKGEDKPKDQNQQKKKCNEPGADPQNCEPVKSPLMQTAECLLQGTCSSNTLQQTTQTPTQPNTAFGKIQQWASGLLGGGQPQTGQVFPDSAGMLSNSSGYQVPGATYIDPNMSNVTSQISAQPLGLIPGTFGKGSTDVNMLSPTPIANQVPHTFGAPAQPPQNSTFGNSPPKNFWDTFKSWFGL